MRTKGSKNKYIQVKVWELVKVLGGDTVISLPEKYAHLFEDGGVIIKGIGLEEEEPTKQPMPRRELLQEIE